MEDTCGNDTCEFEHGLSIYVETRTHRLLVDTGASNKILTNAEKLGIDLSKVDTVILSHGHYDHSGGILPFYKINPKAKIAPLNNILPTDNVANAAPNNIRFVENF